MRKRDAIKEWRQALSRYRIEHRPDEMQLLVPVPHDVFSPPETPVGRTRPLRNPASRQDDFVRAIRVLQRNNRLLLARWGVRWAEAAGFLQFEADRRGMSVALLASALTASLRREARGQAS